MSCVCYPLDEFEEGRESISEPCHVRGPILHLEGGKSRCRDKSKSRGQSKRRSRGESSVRVGVRWIVASTDRQG